MENRIAIIYRDWSILKVFWAHLTIFFCERLGYKPLFSLYLYIASSESLILGFTNFLNCFRHQKTDYLCFQFKLMSILWVKNRFRLFYMDRRIKRGIKNNTCGSNASVYNHALMYINYVSYSVRIRKYFIHFWNRK